MDPQPEETPVDARRRGRRLLLTSVVAGVAAIALAVSLQVMRDGRARVVPYVGGPHAALPPPATEIWPEAIHQLPWLLPNGKRYHPILFLDQDRMLIKTQSKADAADLLASYDLRDGDVKDLVRLAVPLELAATDFAIGSGTMVWRTRHHGPGNYSTDIWTAPVAGGAATLRASLPLDVISTDALHASSSAFYPGSEFSGLSVSGENIYWTTPGTGLWRLPLTGGAPAAQVPGTAGYTLFSYPWVGLPSEQGRSQTGFRDLRNMETGETRTAVIPADKRSWTCSLTRCLGQMSSSYKVDDAAGQARNGSAYRLLPSMEGEGIAQDRFTVLTVYRPQHHAVAVSLVDLKTGAAGLVGRLGVDDGLAHQRIFHDTELYHYKQDGKMIIIDLRAIR
ncbi:hypothetical protein J5X84_28445 [Streptosporangiaceae bacterium NEAU-GS5]|nr:hypothetical protein [Streptosporangiaceae bacterium NEAU-GS5]